MTSVFVRPRGSPAPTVWTVRVGDETVRIRAPSARTALARAEKLACGLPGTIVGLDWDSASLLVPTTCPRPPDSSRSRRKRVLFPEVLRRRDAGETIASIAKAVSLPRETVRDWLLAEARG